MIADYGILIFSMNKNNFFIKNLFRFKILLISIILFFGFVYALGANNIIKLAPKPSVLLSSSSSSNVFIVYGDSRDGHETHAKIVSQIMARKPRAVFHTGDLVNDGNNSSQWTTFNNITAALRQQANFYPSLGNHENNSSLYFANFPAIHNQSYYKVDYPKIHFIILDTNIDIAKGSTQYQWLVRDLKSQLYKNKFIVVIFHQPLFSIGSHGGSISKRRILTPLFDKYHVDAIFSGHDHDYERSIYHQRYYFTTGGGGAPLHGKGTISDSRYSKKFISTYNFCRLKLYGGKLIVDAYDENNHWLDGKAIINR